jgi:hypothetical protein
MWDVVRQNLDWHGDVLDDEPTGYMCDAEEEARGEASDLNDVHGTEFVRFVAVEVDE